MLPRYRMDKKGMTVERIGSSITISLLLIILIVMFLIFELLWTDVSKWFLTIPIAIIFFISIYGLIIQPYYMYRNFRYEINDDEINIKSGIFMIKETTIPMGRIQNVDLYEGFIMRKYNLANITLSTAGGNEMIQYLNKDKANKIKYAIQNRIENDINQ
ncbi:PH domain-containing protein [Mammaliicoccus fleurettii]|uniref:PH domain-containing protein n=1 Tax=Mammaliicoccus fleurettii TaxID=150056 RepID=UPI002DB8C4B4|nr:PH domain-containing protein [Mammaliicoccus fleurettii]MEB7724552.1 PH domain-containing protein [Mammaliicoccus fleurettii]MEB8068710.1 PH domain-containing protein [Mammaliicoccus fleurettii]